MKEGAGYNRFGLSRHIPFAVQRLVREECGWGCAICGEIFVELHHFEPSFRDAEFHDPKGIICLCPSQHALAESGSIGTEYLRKMRSSPFPMESGFVHQVMLLSENTPNIIIGGNVCISKYFKLLVDCIPILWCYPVENGEPYGISAILFDNNYEVKLSIINNVILKRQDGTSVRKVGDRYLIGGETDPEISISFSGSDLHVVRLSISSIFTNLECYVDQMTDQTSGLTIARSLVYEKNLSFGGMPTPLIGRFDENIAYSFLRNGGGETSGLRQGKYIFSEDRRLVGEVIEGSLVRRIFARIDGSLLAEYPTGRIVNDMIVTCEQSREFGLPYLPFPPECVQIIKLFSLRGEVTNYFCITDFFCGASMPGGFVRGGPFLKLFD